MENGSPAARKMNRRILLVDDDPEIVELYSEILEMEGDFVAGVAFNGEEAVQLYKKLKPAPNLVIMDHRMPRKDGIEATAEIIDFDPDAKIVFASADESAVGEALNTGALSFRKKPFTIDELIATINKFAK